MVCTAFFSDLFVPIFKSLLFASQLLETLKNWSPTRKGGGAKIKSQSFAPETISIHNT